MYRVMVCSHCPTPRPIQTPIKMGCKELCGGVHTAPTQQCHRVLLQFVGTGVVVGVSVGQYECAITRTGSNLFTSPDYQQVDSRHSTETFLIILITHKSARR